VDIPEDLLALERAAWAEIQTGQLTADAAAAVQARITEVATETGVDRHTLEMAVKKAVRHPSPEN
jgi:transcriptional regulator of acetoin/glycerol metabolism